MNNELLVVKKDLKSNWQWWKDSNATSRKKIMTIFIYRFRYERMNEMVVGNCTQAIWAQPKSKWIMCSCNFLNGAIITEWSCDNVKSLCFSFL